MKYFGRYHLFVTTVVIVAVSIFGGAVLTEPAHAADCGGIQTSVVDCSDANDTSGSAAVAILVLVIQILTGLIGVTAIGAFIYAGIMYASASGNVSQVAKSKEMMRNTIIGLLIFAGLAVLLNFLIPGGLFEGSAKFGAGGNGLGSSTASRIQKNPDLGNPSEPSSDDSDIVSTTPYSLTLASWNTHKDNTVNKGDSVTSLMASADIIGMQEVHALVQRKNIQSAESSRIGVYYASTLQGGGSSQLSYPIAYNKDKLAFVSGGYKRLGSTPGYSDQYATYVRLRIKATGQEVYFANTNLPPGVESGGKPQSTATAASYQKEMPVLASLMKQLGAKGVPTFLAGDLSVDFRKETCDVSWFPCKGLRGADMKSTFEIMRLDGISSSTGTHKGSSRLVDYLFVRTDSRVKVNGISVLGSSNGFRGSDHRPSLSRVTITAQKNTLPSDNSQTPAPSAIALKGVENFRDLAKFNSSLIKPGVIYRSGKLEGATTADRTKLASVLKGGVIIDFRTASKRSAEPDRSISGVPNLNYDIDAAAGADEYVKVFVNDKQERLEFGKALKKIADTKGAVLFHCTYGKDRTGWMAAMVMYIVGANDQQVMNEYLKSRDAGLKVEKAWLNAALSAARKNNGGSIMNYITSDSKGLGVSDTTIAKLRAKVGK